MATAPTVTVTLTGKDIKLLNSKILRNKLAEGGKKTIKRFSLKNTADALEKIYKNAIKAN